ncbi:MAG: hypothetical protein P8Z31_08980 [Gammaproteobacteria bacterium]|jgi:Cu/Ag efflux protein CusF
MKTRNTLMICLGLALAQPAFAQDATQEELGDLRPESDMEAPPIALGEDMLVESTSTVEEINKADRLITLKGAEGNMVTVRAGDEVKNFDQISKGDKVTVSYYSSAAVDIIEPGSKPRLEVDTAVERAKPGEMPGAVVVNQVRKTVKILSVDPYKKAISFRDESGWREVSMDRPELEPYLKELKDGDTVEVIFTEALAVSVTKH